MRETCCRRQIKMDLCFVDTSNKQTFDITIKGDPVYIGLLEGVASSLILSLLLCYI